MVKYLLLVLSLFTTSLLGAGFRVESLDFSSGGIQKIMEELEDHFYYDMGCRDQEGGVDIVFCIDSTGSMGSTLRNVTANIGDFISALEAGGYDYRLGGVPYGDATNIWDSDPSRPGNQLYADTADFMPLIRGCGPSGGGDGPELQIDAMADAIRLYEWRPTTLHVLINFTDINYHYRGDGTTFSDELDSEVYDLVMATGTVAFFAATTGHATADSWYSAVSLDSGGQRYPLSTGWDVIFPDVVSLIGESAVVNISAINATGVTLDTVYATLLGGDCIDISSNDTLRLTYLPPMDTVSFGWRVVVDSSCTGNDICFSAIFWNEGREYVDTVYGCATNENCYPSMPKVIIHRPDSNIYDMCPNDSIVLSVYDTMFSIEPSSLEMVLERRYFDGSMESQTYDYTEINFTEPSFVLHPDPPFQDGEITTAMLTGCENTMGVVLMEDIRWSFSFDFSPPVFSALFPPCSTVLGSRYPDSISIFIYDSVTGVDPSSIELDIDGNIYNISDPALEYEDGHLVFFPELAGLAWQGGDYVPMTFRASDTPSDPINYCGPNLSSFTCGFFIETGGPMAELVRPLNNTSSGCEDEYIRIYLFDEDGLYLDETVIEINDEVISWGDHRLQYIEEDSLLVFIPDVPYQHGDTIAYTIVYAEDMLGNPLENHPSATFVMDLLPPEYDLVNPPDSAWLILATDQSISIDFSDDVTGVDTSSIIFYIGDRLMPRETYRITYDATTLAGNLLFEPAYAGTSFVQGDSVFFSIESSDSTTYCDDNVSFMEHIFMIEPTVYCNQYPDPFTPNGDNYNDLTVFEYPFMYSDDAKLLIFNKRREKVYEGNLGLVSHRLDILSHAYDGRDSEGELLSPGLYLYIILRNGEAICEGTMTVVR